jgi:hypothetical protein
MVSINNSHQKFAVDFNRVTIKPKFWREWNRKCEEKAFEMIREGHQMTENSVGQIYIEVTGDNTLFMKCEIWGSQLTLEVPVGSWNLNTN